MIAVGRMSPVKEPSSPAPKQTAHAINIPISLEATDPISTKFARVSNTFCPNLSQVAKLVLSASAPMSFEPVARHFCHTSVAPGRTEARKARLSDRDTSHAAAAPPWPTQFRIARRTWLAGARALIFEGSSINIPARARGRAEETVP